MEAEKFQRAVRFIVMCIVCIAAEVLCAQTSQRGDGPSVKLTADFWRAIKKPDVDGVRQLLARDARLAKVREAEGGNTALHIAATAELAEALISSGADIEAVDSAHFATPLRWAAGDRRSDVVKLLLARGGKVTDIYLACAVGDVDLVKAFLKRDSRLLEAPALRCDYLAEADHATEATRDQAGHTTVTMIAIYASQAKIVAALLEAGADPAAVNDEGATLMHLAAWRANPEMIGALRASGAPLDTEDSQYHNTPLGWAIVNGNVENVRALIAAGATIRPDFPDMAEKGRQGEYKDFAKGTAEDYEKIGKVLKK